MHTFVGILLFGSFAVLPGQTENTFDAEKITGTVIEVLQESPREDLFSQEAVDLLVMTHIIESVIKGKIHKKQTSGGPAQGMFQMEPTTEKDIWEHYLRFPKNKDLREWVLSYASSQNPQEKNLKGPRDLKHNVRYQIAMARIYYERRTKISVARKKDYVEQLAYLWKNHYNSPLGKGSVEKAIQKYKFYSKELH